MIVSLLTLSIGGVCGWLISEKQSTLKALPLPADVRVDSKEYQFINPLIFERTSKSFYVDEFKDFNTSLDDFVKKTKNNNSVDNISIYFRDLNSGHWTGINENDTYEPASMLKVLVMIGALRLAISGSDILSKKIYYSGPDDSGQNYKPDDNLTAGYYTVQQMIDAMIFSSDNGAAKALLSDSGIDTMFNEAYSLFRLPTIDASSTTDYMSPRSYSAVFRILYNSTYLPWGISEQALQFLSKTSFTKGIVAGVPHEVVVSHKFGEYVERNQDGTLGLKELHDCGIVYVPSGPYLLCVMTKGDDWGALEKTISDVSAMAYQYVKSKK